jgi:hypothetical protein
MNQGTGAIIFFIIWILIAIWAGSDGSSSMG